MTRELFETRAISVFHERKYVFFNELQHGRAIEKMTTAQYAGLVAVGALVGLGAFMINGATIVDSKVKAELAKLAPHCDLVGIRVATGSVNLVLFIYSDDLTDETIIGKCHLIREELAPFKEFAMRIGWHKNPVIATVFFVFSNSEKAFHFRTSVQDHCKQHGLFSKRWVLPWGIDLAAKSVWAHRGLPLNWKKPSEIEEKLFS